MGYMRLIPMRHYEIKTWTENFNEIEKNFDFKPELAENSDHDSLLFTAKRLAQRQEKRKILMVLSDGLPANGCSYRSVLHDLLKTYVNKIEDAGIDVIGIGIKHEGVRNFYKNHMVINDIKELPEQLLRLLDDILLSKYRRG